MGKKGYRDNPQNSTLPNYFKEFPAILLSLPRHVTLKMRGRLFHADFTEVIPLELLDRRSGPKLNCVGPSQVRQKISWREFSVLLQDTI